MLTTLMSYDATKRSANYYIYIYIYIYIYTLPPPPEFERSGEELTAATCIRQSSSNELSTPVFDSTKCKQTKATTKCVMILQLT